MRDLGTCQRYISVDGKEILLLSRNYFFVLRILRYGETLPIQMFRDRESRSLSKRRDGVETRGERDELEIGDPTQERTLVHRTSISLAAA